MSIDTVDDLHCAEDALGSVTKALGDLLGVLGVLGPGETIRLAALSDAVADGSVDEVAAAARDAFYRGANYCRPSCEHDEEDGVWECGEDCGCPGVHVEPGHGLPGDEPSGWPFPSGLA